jgi:TonB family protein
MAHSTVPNSEDNALPGWGAPHPVATSLASQPAPPSEAAAILGTLRQSSESGSETPDSIFLATADAARVLSGADGIALALLTGGAVVCRARSGELAPEIGYKLNVDSGISGLCFRTSTLIRCDNTQSDDRVDPELCRQLGIGSIAAIPLRGRDGTAGILEAFSAKAQAFSDEQVRCLERLAEIVETACERERRATESALAEPGPVVEAVSDEASHSQIRRELFAPTAATDVPLASAFSQEPPDSKRRYWIMGTVALVMLTAAVAWISWREPDTEVAASQPAPTQIRPDAAAPSAALNVIPKPDAGTAGTTSEEPPATRILRSAAKIESDEAAPTRIDRTSGPTLKTSSRSADTTAQESSPAPDAPQFASVGTDDATIRSMISSKTTLPGLDIPVSQGVTESVLIHKVQPVYPPKARIDHVEGSVVLDATIGEDGQTRDLKIVSGPQLLAQAAADAVHQWRYRPSLLNGKPIAVQKQITIVFKEP